MLGALPPLTRRLASVLSQKFVAKFFRPERPILPAPRPEAAGGLGARRVLKSTLKGSFVSAADEPPFQGGSKVAIFSQAFGGLRPGLVEPAFQAERLVFLTRLNRNSLCLPLRSLRPLRFKKIETQRTQRSQRKP